MIAYDLQCSNGHRFEGWFEDAKTFEKQNKQALIACPMCNDTAITRLPSTFAIKGIKSSQTTTFKPKTPAEAEIIMRAISDYVEQNFDNVGTDFAKEALKIHYGVTEPRNIRGVSTSQEEETLRQEGVQFFKFPAGEEKPAPPSSSESESD